LGKIFFRIRPFEAETLNKPRGKKRDTSRWSSNGKKHPESNCDVQRHEKKKGETKQAKKKTAIAGPIKRKRKDQGGKI